MMTVIIIFHGATNSNTRPSIWDRFTTSSFKLAPEMIKMGHNGSLVYNTSREISQCG